MDASFFRTHGYQVFEKVIPLDLVEQTRLFLEQDAKQSLLKASNEIGCTDQAGIVSVIDAIANGTHGSVDQLSKSTRDTLSGHISLETRLSAELRKIPSHPGVMSVVRAVLGSNKIYMHMPPTARFVLSGNIHAGVPAHQDISYNKHMSNFVTVWVPLVDIDDECGGVVVFEGSGSEPERAVSHDPKNFWQSGVPADAFKPIHCKIQRGDLLVLNKYVIHASKANISDRTRYSIDQRFFGEHDSSSKHYLDMQTNEVIAPRELAA